jgi:hypothetical protein
MEVRAKWGQSVLVAKYFLVIYEAVLRPLVSVSSHQELSTCFHTFGYAGLVNASTHHILQPMYDKPVEKHQHMRQLDINNLNQANTVHIWQPVAKPISLAKLGCPHLGVAKFPKIMALPEVFF